MASKVGQDAVEVVSPQSHFWTEWVILSVVKTANIVVIILAFDILFLI